MSIYNKNQVLDNEYYLKYLKYKEKYINLKKSQIGGLTRKEIYDRYNNNISSFKNNNEKNLTLLLHSYNRPYGERVNSGLWYSSDYANIVNRNDDSNQFIGFTNKKFWDITTSIFLKEQTVSFFLINENIKPSDALKSFIIGPTFCECANVIQVTFYNYILNLIGENKFNELFGNILTPFIITPLLFTPMMNFPRNKTYKNKYDPIVENPIYFLFDKIDVLDIDQIQNNDIVYIQGVQKYQNKHFSGSFSGWNLICDKPTLTDELKFIGFGPNEFKDGPKTYEQMKTILIDGYNINQNRQTVEVIDAREGSTEKYLKLTATIAKSLKDDKVEYTSPIGGITHILRFNLNKLCDFINKPRQKWYQDNIDELTCMLPPINKIKINLLLKSFSFETTDSTFENYIIENEEQQKLYNYMKRFALKVITKTPEYGPIGFVLNGNAGIGKTHLSVSIAKFASTYGINVTYVDNEFIEKKYNESRGTLTDFTSWINGSDLLILDDINDNDGIGSIFIQQSIKYIILHSKALLFSSNNKLAIIQKHLPILYSYDHQYATNFFAFNSFDADSFRKPWTTENILKFENEGKFILLNSYDGKQAAGIIVSVSDLSEENLIENFNKITGNSKPIKIIDNKSNLTNIEDNKFIIMKVNDYNNADLLIKILPTIHDNGIKVIILTNSIDQFQKLILEQLQSYTVRPYVKRLTDRIKIIFPGL